MVAGEVRFLEVDSADSGLSGPGEPEQLDVGRSLTERPEDVLKHWRSRAFQAAGFHLAEVSRKVDKDPQGSVTRERACLVAGTARRLVELRNRQAVAVVILLMPHLF